jgi:hypothetical protein
MSQTQNQRARKFVWSDPLRAELRAAYIGNKPHITAALDLLERRSGFPRSALKYEAGRLGIGSADHRRPWTEAEQAYLEENLGDKSVWAIARRLQRTHGSVCSRAVRLGLSRRCRNRYNIADLVICFGESREKIRRWMDRGWLGTVEIHGGDEGHSVTHASVRAFVLRHYHEYDFRRVDQSWLKTMIFEDNNGAAHWL